VEESIEPSLPSPGEGRSPGGSRRKAGFLALALLFVVAFQLGRTYRFAETDLWWNLAAGREIVLTHSLPRHDTWAFTPTLPEWHNHEWLSQIVFFSAWSAFGPAGMIYLKTFLILLIFLLGAAAALKRGAGPIAVSFFMMLTSIGLYPITSIRPQIFTYLFFAWFLFLVGEGDIRSRTRAVLALASVPLWVGFHGGFVVGLAILSVYAAARVGDVGWEKGKSLLFLVGACWGMTVVNPYGIGHWSFLIEAMRHDRSMFAEWSPVAGQWVRQWPFFLALSASVFSLAVSRRHKSKAELALLVFTAFLGFSRVRFVPFFIISAWVFVPVHWESALRFLGGHFQPVSKAVLTAGSFILVLYGAVCVFYSADQNAFRWDWRLKLAIHDDPWHVGFPVDLVQYMKEKALWGRVACPLAWGGFLEWELPGQVKVNLDGRWDTVYPQDVILQGHDFANGINWQAYLKRYEPDIVLAFQGGPLDRGLSTLAGWTRLYEGRSGVLFIRKNFPPGKF